jgi:hypothetical protein
MVQEDVEQAQKHLTTGQRLPNPSYTYRAQGGMDLNYLRNDRKGIIYCGVHVLMHLGLEHHKTECLLHHIPR